MTSVAPRLLVGSVDDAFDTQLLSRYNVTSILNVASELHFCERLGLRYYKVGIDDDCHKSDVRTILPQCIEIIHENMKQDDDGKMLIHCLEGKSRSVCVALAYMMKLYPDWNSNLQHLKDVRPTIDIFPLYLEQTKIFTQNQENIRSGTTHPTNPSLHFLSRFQLC